MRSWDSDMTGIMENAKGIHDSNVKNTEIWEDNDSNTSTLSNSKLASAPLF